MIIDRGEAEVDNHFRMVNILIITVSGMYYLFYYIKITIRQETLHDNHLNHNSNSEIFLAVQKFILDSKRFQSVSLSLLVIIIWAMKINHSAVHILFWSFEISDNILRNQK